MQPCNTFIIGYFPSCLRVLASGNALPLLVHITSMVWIPHLTHTCVTPVARTHCTVMWETSILCSFTNRSQISRIVNLWPHSRITCTTHLVSSVKIFLGQPLLSLLWMFFHFSSWNQCIHKCALHSGIMFTPYTYYSCLCMASAERFSVVRKHITAGTSH